MTAVAPEKTLYTARVTVTGGRTGSATSEDGVLDLSLTAPKEAGGPGTGTNPEQLFAAGYAACFTSALTAVAKQDNVDVTGVTTVGEVDLGPVGAGYGIAVTLRVSVPGLDRSTLSELLAKAHQVCPYSNATRGNIPVDLVAI
jgi:osmotically inducible protein OsmC